MGSTSNAAATGSGARPRRSQSAREVTSAAWGSKPTRAHTAHPGATRPEAGCGRRPVTSNMSRRYLGAALRWLHRPPPVQRCRRWWSIRTAAGE